VKENRSDEGILSSSYLFSIMKFFNLLSYFTLYFFLQRNTANRPVIPQIISKPGMLVFFPASGGIGLSLCPGDLTFAGVLPELCG
jgi:hypothetical protein